MVSVDLTEEEAPILKATKKHRQELLLEIEIHFHNQNLLIEDSLYTTYVIPQRRVPLRNDPWGPLGLNAFFTLFYCFENFHPPLRCIDFWPLYCDGGRRRRRRAGAYLRFGTLDHVRTIFFKFIGLYGVWHEGGTILKSV